jgi:hypothetical protein
MKNGDNGERSMARGSKSPVARPTLRIITQRLAVLLKDVADIAAEPLVAPPERGTRKLDADALCGLGVIAVADDDEAIADTVIADVLDVPPVAVPAQPPANRGRFDVPSIAWAMRVRVGDVC